MSYDLFFKPSKGELDLEAFFQYLSDRPGYKVDDPQAIYENDDTGVYFIIETNDMDDDEKEDGEEEDDSLEYPLQFRLNLIRPSYFVDEAELEVTALVNHFDFLVFDDQIEGMARGQYDKEKFKSTWKRINESGYGTVFRDSANDSKILSLETERLEEIWVWNFGRSQFQSEIGPSKFVPQIVFAELDGSLVAAAVWPDAIASVLPRVDFLIVPRREFAPRKLFKRVEDHAVVPWDEASAMIEKHSELQSNMGYMLRYDTPPTEIVNLVGGFSPFSGSMDFVSPSDVLNREYIEKYRR